MLCFHGYGEEASAFAFFEEAAKEDYCLIMIDLPFHGESVWLEEQVLTTDMLLEIINSILRKEGYTENGFILCGFSLGGRVALSLYEKIPQKVHAMVLLAPDGLKLNFWYWFATQTWAGIRLFSFTMRKPAWFFNFLSILYKVRLVNASIYKFVRHYVDDEEARMILFKRWMVLRKLRPQIKFIKEKIRQHQTRVDIIYGKHDRIILPVRGEKFRKGIEPYCFITVIRSGHQVLHEAHAKELYPILFK